MNHIFHKAISLAGIVTIIACVSGCDTLNKAINNKQTVTAPTLINDTLPQICLAARNNRVVASDLYVNKELAIKGEVISISEGFQPRYRVFIKSGKIAVHAGTENKLAVKQVAVGRSVSVTGTITDVSYDYQGCSVSLKDARF